MRKRIENRIVPSVEEAVKVFLAQREVSGVRPSTVRQERSLLCSLVRLIGPEKPADAVTVRDIEAAIERRRAEGLSSNTLHHLGKASKRLFQWLSASGLVKENPVTGLRVVRVEQARIRPMTREQVTRLLAACDTSRFSGVRNRTLIVFLYDTGLRASEALGVRLSDLDLDTRTVSVVGKGNRPRTVCFGRQAAAEVRAYLARRGELPNNPWLFCDEWGQGNLKYNALRLAIGRLAVRAGLEGVRASCHTLRHSFSREWVLGGGDVASLSAQLGHSSLEMTSRYVTTLLGDVAKVHERVSPADRLATSPVGRKRL